jgi:hypothetical protein
MTIDRKDQDIRNNQDHDHANDNGNKPGVVTTTKGGALGSSALTQLSTTLNNMSFGGGSSGRPMMLFKSRTDGGVYSYGRTGIIPEDGSKWAANPLSAKYGYIQFDAANKPTERLAPISQPMPSLAELPDMGFEWKEEWTIDLKCLDGADAGVEVTLKMSTYGGIQALTGVLEAVRDRINSDQHDDKIVPVVCLEKYSYQHPQYGPTVNPLLTIISWMAMDGPAPASEPASPPPPVPPAPPASAAEQPRRRRVV